MLSFSSLITVAVSFLALSAPALAFEASDSSLAARGLDLSNSLVGRDLVDFEKRASNKPNPGARCRGNYMCHTRVHNARPSCSAKGICGFKCKTGHVLHKGQCIVKRRPHTCGRHRHCPSHVQHGSGFCYHGKCTFRCNTGYHREGVSCVKNQKKCNSTKCYPVEDGYSTCHAGKCSYHCATYLGFTLFTNSAKTAYRCVDLADDPENCGSLGNECPVGYNGRGVATCVGGTCGLDCSGYSHKYTLNGQAYCTDH